METNLIYEDGCAILVANELLPESKVIFKKFSGGSIYGIGKIEVDDTSNKHEYRLKTKRGDIMFDTLNDRQLNKSVTVLAYLPISQDAYTVEGVASLPNFTNKEETYTIEDMLDVAKYVAYNYLMVTSSPDKSFEDNCLNYIKQYLGLNSKPINFILGDGDTLEEQIKNGHYEYN